MSERRKRLRTLMLGSAFTAIVAFGFFFGSEALAQTSPSADSLGLYFGQYTGLSGQDIRITIAKVIRTALGLLGIVAVLIILYAGFQWMTAAGEEEKIGSAKKTLTAGIIGLVIIMSAFAIASFVLNGLVEASGGGAATAGGGGPGGGLGGGAGGSGGFRVTKIAPTGDLKKRDVVVFLTFNSSPTSDTSNVNANVILEREQGSGREALAYDVTKDGNTIELRPVTTCPEPNQTKRCLEADTKHFVTIKAGLKDAIGRTINCGIAGICGGTFKTGDVIGLKPPTAEITYPKDGESVPEKSIVQIQSLLADENGIGTVKYDANGTFFGSGAWDSVSEGQYLGQVDWDTKDFAPVQSVELKARVMNIDGDGAESSNAPKVWVRPLHCFNAKKDADEVAVDCGGKDCGSCAGASCKVNGDCSSGECIDGVCVENPVILDVQLRDGKPGNMVTIIGQRFGGSAGKVVFLGDPGSDDDDTEAPLGECADAWSSERVAVKVPEGAVSGPIRLTTSGNKTDSTNDRDRGPIIVDFAVNDIARPGICSVSPVTPKVRDTLSVSGEGFGGTQGGSKLELVTAGADCVGLTPETVYEAGAATSWTETGLQSLVPNVAVGSNGTKYLVRVQVGGQYSNTACLQVQPPEAGTLPKIDSMSPTDGSVGTYVTLIGANFGSGGKVEFKNGTGTAYGKTDFPAQCSDGYWTSSSVTVKVPDAFTVPAGKVIDLNDYDVRIVRADGAESETMKFTINTKPVGPGICKISPDNGPEALGVAIYGENFGGVSAADMAAVFRAHPDSVRFHDAKNITSPPGLWNGNQISVSVPRGAVTGPVTARKYSGTSFVQSNGVNFQVLDCRTAGGDAACSAGLKCCGDGTCRTEAACDAPPVSGGFAWQFSTGPIPAFPVVLESATCSIGAVTEMPSPNPFKGVTDVCTDMRMMAVSFSLPMDEATFSSQNIVFESCGILDAISEDCAPEPTGDIAIKTGSQGQENMMTISTSGLTAKTWYKLTIKDKVRSLAGQGRASEFFDGDFDGEAGGDYVTTFRAGEGPCTLAAVDVLPDQGLIESAAKKQEYTAYPISAACIILSCEGRAASWSSSEPGKATVSPTSGAGQCLTLATPKAETVPGPDVVVEAVIDGKKDAGNLKIDYLNPLVEKYGPANCTEACVNTLPFAQFNTEMSVSGPDSVLTAVELKRCKNENCLSFDGDVPLQADFLDSDKTLYLNRPTPSELVANTYYRVIIKGNARSSGGASMTGFNYKYGASQNNAFSWTFRTRQASQPCGPTKVTVTPPQTTLRYINEVSAIMGLPTTAPDSCSATGQLLTQSSFNWSWQEKQEPPAPDAFTLAPYHPAQTPAALNTSDSLPTGCTSRCLFSGSQKSGTSVCGNGKLETPYEACDTPGENGCSDKCLYTGNNNASCGDGQVSAVVGEECDEGPANGEKDSGCSKTCLLTGSSGGGSTCGNRDIAAGEACDDGNQNPGDGCDANCLREGSSRNVAVCGNGSLEFGEQCDYSTSAGVAGANLLAFQLGGQPKQVTVSAAPGAAAFPCGATCVFKGNANVCSGTSATGCCGDGQIDYAKGENCDAKTMNGESGSGCSELCLKTGSDLGMRAFCGDKEVTMGPPNTAAGIMYGGGEDCDTETADANIDATQYVTALNRCDANLAPQCVGIVNASIGSISGEANVNVECSCRADSDCAAFGGSVSLACGVGACCFPRPGDPTLEPTGQDECRNTRVSVVFPEEMNPDTFKSALILAEIKGTCIPPRLQAAGYPSGPRGWFARAKDAVAGFFRKVFFRQASAADEKCATVTGDWKFINLTDGNDRVTTKAYFLPKAAYGIDATYELSVKGGPSGVKNKNGIGYSGDWPYTQRFRTGKDICTLDALEVKPGQSLIDNSATAYTFEATAITNRGGQSEEIDPIPGVYAWGYGWTATAEPIAPGDLIVLTPNAAAGNASASVKATPAKNGEVQLIAAATITADTITNPAPPADAPPKVVTGKSDVTILICENLWPKRAADGSWTPYVDQETHFKFYYCRDTASGKSLLPNLEQTPLPAKTPFTESLLRFCSNLKDGPQQPKSCLTDDDCGGVVGACRSKDLFFRFSEKSVRDVIGLRVYDNPTHASPQSWYEAEERRFSGSPAAAVVDGFNAIKDERTTYVSAPDKYGDPELRSYIYVLGYSDKSSPETALVYEQLLANMGFNTNLGSQGEVLNVCKSMSPLGGMRPYVDKDGTVVACDKDSECDKLPEFAEDRMLGGTANKQPAGMFCDSRGSKIRRDMRRWEDLVGMSESLEQTRKDTGFYPKIESGSFIRGLTTSKWPSWSQLGAAAKFVDPINEFNRCERLGSECAVKKNFCKDDKDCDADVTGDVCKPKFDAVTCFDNRHEVFMSPLHSNAYIYQAVGGADYELIADFEYTAYDWGPKCSAARTQYECELQLLCRWNATTSGCSSRLSGHDDNVSKGDLNTTYACVELQTPCTEDAACGANKSCLPATNGANGATLFGGGVAKKCGNGILESGEACETGNERTIACPGVFGNTKERCNASCVWQAVPGQSCPASGPVCGNGSVEFSIDGNGTRLGETCDDGVDTGGYGRCRSGSTYGCQKRCVNVQQRASFTPASDIGAACASNAQCGAGSICTDRMMFCGDGVKNGSESCDDGPLNGQYGKCAWNCLGTGPRCGDQIVNGSESCDGTGGNSVGICIPPGDWVDEESEYADDVNAKPCTRNVDCASNEECYLCGPNPNDPLKLPRSRTRACQGDVGSGQSCSYKPWSACLPSGSCGNGKVEGSEQCDDGTANGKNAKCLPTCQKNVCNDGFILAGTEQCDNGTSNGVACVPLFGATCNYCLNTCAVATVSGGYCGDGTLTTPPNGSEQCEGTQGLAARYICVGKAPEDESYGKLKGSAVCATDSCQRVCQDPSTAVCDNLSGTVSNTDRYSGTPEACPPGDTYCNSSQYRTLGGPISTELEEIVASSVPVLNDVCDPDDDNDGVPDYADCAPRDYQSHGAHKVPADGSKINIQPAVEACDGKDNDCNGLIDNIYQISGKIVDAQTGNGVSGATMVAYCGGSELIRRDTDQNGDYKVDIGNDSRVLACDKIVTILGTKPGWCFNQPSQQVTFDLKTLGNPTTSCVYGRVPQIEMITEPLPGRRTFVLTWGEKPLDLNMHIKYKYPGSNPQCAEQHIITPTLQTDCSGSSCGAYLDVDDQNSYGPETLTVQLRPGGKYKVYVEGRCNGGDYGEPCSGDPALNSAAANAKVRVWGPGCTHRLYSASPDSKADVQPSTGTISNPGSWSVFDIAGDGQITNRNSMGDFPQFSSISCP